ncbi:hypothetical protein BKA63DRAFT_598920 [Paraphoma chrysanthemicola]|nr:hypothetical protein BKA63DRAFT_598920 [Paraphoma chrysanthemicola]
MPRNGDGSSDNGPFEEAKHDILHGAGPSESGEVARAKNTAPMPKHDKGDAVTGLNGSGGGYSLPTTGNDGKGSVG